MELRDKFEKIDPSKLGNLQGMYDLVAAKIHDLDVAANLYFQTKGALPMGPFTPKFAPAQKLSISNSPSQPTMDEKI